MIRSGARRARADRLTRLLAASAAVAGVASAVVAGPATAAPGSGDWARVVNPDLSRKDLRLPAGAPLKRLAERAIERSAGKLVKGGELDELRFAGEPVAARAGAHVLRFEQSLGGLRVLWTKLDVGIAGGEVVSISATSVPVRGRLAGTVEITAARAKKIALKAAPGAGDSVRVAELTAFAGAPDKPRAPRRAFVVDVAPARYGTDIASDLCVVVDAQTGKVLSKWDGFAASKPQPSGKTASAAGVQAHAAAVTQLIRTIDANGTTAVTTPNYHQVTTPGNPYLFGADLEAFGIEVSGSGLGQNAFVANNWMIDIGTFACITRHFCGRDSGLAGPIVGGTYNRINVTANWLAPAGIAAQFDPNQDRMFISTGASNNPGTIAHEFGHNVDFRFKGDDLHTRESQEVAEAYANMWALDYELVTGHVGDRPSRLEQATNPGAFKRFGCSGANCARANDYHEYVCSTDVHDNGWLLVRGYLRLTQLISVRRAGDVLQWVPLFLPPARTFSSVRQAFRSATAAAYGANAPEVEAVRTAFNFVNVGATTATRPTRCPGQQA